MRESEAQLATRYKSRLQMEIELEMIVACTYTVDDIYQLALKIEEGLSSSLPDIQVHKLRLLSSIKQQANH